MAKLLVHVTAEQSPGLKLCPVSPSELNFSVSGYKKKEKLKGPLLIVIVQRKKHRIINWYVLKI